MLTIKKILFKHIPYAVSLAFHPLIMPTFGIFILFNSGTYISFLPVEFKRSVYLIVAICTIGIPLVFIPFYIYRKIIVSSEMDTRQERIIPLIVTTVLFYAAFYILNNHNIPQAITLFILGSTFCVLGTLLFSIKWKISAHMVGLGGIVGLIVACSLLMHSDMIFYLIIFLFLSGMVASSRLLLNSHSPFQVYAGFFLGFLIMVSTLFIL